MRTPKAYIAGFGTTTVLVASAVLLLAVVSTLVAFKGWPGSDVTEGIGNLVVEEPAQVALNASTAARAVASVPAPGSAAAGSPAAVPTGPVEVPLPTAVTPVSGGDRGAAGGAFREDALLQQDPLPPPPISEQPGGLLPEMPISGEVRRLTDGLADTTEGLTDGLGTTVGQLNPGAGQLLINAGEGLSELVRNLAEPRR